MFTQVLAYILAKVFVQVFWDILDVPEQPLYCIRNLFPSLFAIFHQTHVSDFQVLESSVFFEILFLYYM